MTDSEEANSLNGYKISEVVKFYNEINSFLDRKK